MSGIISGNMVGGASPLRTLILTDADGNEFTGIVTSSEVIFTATDDDVREGVVYASDGGASVGTMELPPHFYALVDTTGLCHEVLGTSKNLDGENGYVSISKYDSNYLNKYYNVNDELWYMDASFATRWI